MSAIGMLRQLSPITIANHLVSNDVLDVLVALRRAMRAGTFPVLILLADEIAALC
jgi:hypothetical protein